MKTLCGGPDYLSRLYLRHTFLGRSARLPWAKAMKSLVLASLSLFVLTPITYGVADESFFETKIRPVLVEHCQSCHSVKSGKSKGGLLLDSGSAVIKGGESGPIIDLKDPKKSKIIIAMSYEEPDLLMPPKGKLPPAVVKDFQTWIASGAVWPGEKRGATAGSKKETFDLGKRKDSHWVWGPLKSTLGTVKSQSSATTNSALDPVDTYLDLARKAKGIQAAGPADPATLYRRLHLVLTGMGPNEASLQKFLADPSEANYQKEVDRILDSWDHSEHFARHWLDLVRYGETRGHEFDFTIPNAWQYRDYAIRALKMDIPFNQFLTEHLAGDLIANPRKRPGADSNESVLGTGFFFLGEEIHSPVDVRQDQADRFDNRIDVLTKTFLGLTVSCARCHDHKFDAISIKDYYGLYSMLESSSYRQIRFEHQDSNRLLALKWTNSRMELEKKLAKALAQKLRESNFLEFPKLAQDSVVSLWFEGKEEKSPGKAIIDYAQNPEWFPDDLSFGPGPRLAGAIDLTGKQPSVNPFGSATRDPLWTGLGPTPESEKEPGGLAYDRTGRTLKTPTFPIQTGSIWVWMRGQAKIFSSVGSHILIMGPLHGEMIADSGPSDTFRWVRLNLGRYKGLPGHLEFTTDDPRFALSMVFDSEAQPTNPAWNHFPKQIAVKERPGHLKERLAKWIQHLETTGSLDGLKDQALAAIALNGIIEAKAIPPLEQSTPTVLAWKKNLDEMIPQRKLLSAAAPALWEGSQVTDRVFIRGSPKVPGAAVEPQNLEALSQNHQIKGPGSRRLQLAQDWINPQKTPMVPRVAVNRIWHHLFGRGIVQSVDNLGVLGDAIQNKDLLDQLAIDFVQDGWSNRKMIRRLVLTNAWRQSSETNSQAMTVDPENRLVHHFHPKRMSGESIRDNLLRISGRLSDKKFGPPIAPWINDFQEGRGRPNSGKLDEEGRRSIYVGVRRNFLSNWMLTFDTPIPFSTVGRRSESHVPAQSLILMNHPLVHELCQSWGQKLASMQADPVERIRLMFREAFGREATGEEIGTCMEYIKSRGASGDPEAWKGLAHILVNTREFVFIR
jgi:hypothetical protein